MSLSPQLTALFAEVERLTGMPVAVERDGALAVPGRFKMARSGARTHVATYNPASPTAEYHLAFEASFTLRLYSLPDGERKLFASTGRGLDAIRGALPDTVPEGVREKFATQLHDGLLTQLRSQPIGMRINERLRVTHPKLAEQQAEAIAQEQSQAAQALAPNVEAIAPRDVYRASVSMNAATALFADLLLGISRFGVPYAARGFDRRGQELLDAWNAIPEGSEGDRQRVDSWAGLLGVTDWYRWVPLQ